MITFELNRLNGWQRLWLLLAVLWLPSVVFIAATFFPTEAQWRVEASIEEIKLNQEKQLKRDEIFAHCDNLGAKRLLDLDICLQAHRQQLDNLRPGHGLFAESLKGYVERRISEHLLSEQVEAAGKGVALWVVPIGLLYVLGMGVAWIRKGFKSSV